MAAGTATINSSSNPQSKSSHDRAAAPAVQGQQRFFVGHTAFVSCLALGGGGTLLATGQEGRQPVIRLWKFAAGTCSTINQQMKVAKNGFEGQGRGPSSQQQQPQHQGGRCLAVLCGGLAPFDRCH
jgi:hypothetical protein